MADFMGNKKRLTINLSLFAPNEPNNNNNSSTKSSTTKSPKTFEPNGVVGLGIVAAMNELDQTHDPFFSAKSSRVAILALSPRSTPIPIGTINNSSKSAKFGAKSGGAGGGGGSNSEEEEMELSEEYTCVISHIGNNMIKKREYFDDNLANGSERTTRYCMGSKLFSDSPPPARSLGRDVPAMGTAFQTEDFLNSCYLCKKKLHGLDIFMYRGEKAFCSVDCRCKQISIDEHKEKEKCGSGVMKQLEYSVSPCSGPMQFFAGVAAA